MLGSTSFGFRVGTQIQRLLFQLCFGLGRDRRKARERFIHFGEKQLADEPNHQRHHCSQGGQVFVNRDLDQRVVVERLRAAFHGLLLHPIAKRADDPLEEAVSMVEKCGVKDDENTPEN